MADHLPVERGAVKHGSIEHESIEHASAEQPDANFAARAAATLFFTFFPTDCRICGYPLIEISRLPVCKLCIFSLRPLQGSHCTVCGEALDLASCVECGEAECDEVYRPEKRCLLCQRADPPYVQAVAYGSYEGALRDLIHLLKFQQIAPAAKVLGRLLAKTISKLAESIQVDIGSAATTSGSIAVMPVPLHERKRAQRGFNQAELIARSALKELASARSNARCDLCVGTLVRRRETGSQIGLTNHQRRQNLRGAFAVSNPTRILNRNILLVDDVFTTGTTVSECARVLLRAGAARVWVATVARTVKISNVNISDAFGFEQISEEESIERRRMAAHG